MTRRLVIDNDGGVDDCTGIWWALTEPDVEVVALIATWGNTERDAAAANLCRILHAAGRPDIPVALGATDPSGPSPLSARAAHVHGADGLGGHAHRWPTGEVVPTDERPADLLARLVAADPGAIDLVTTGPLTTLAAVLAERPGLTGGFRSLTVMGGSVLAGGNALPAAEANVAHDPEAAAAVVAAPWATDRPPLLVGLDVTMAALLSADVELAAAHASDGVVARFLADPMDGYLAFYDSVRQTPPGMFPCHDLLAVMAAAERPVITGVETWPIAVDTGGSAAWGATIADRRPVPESTLGAFAPWRVAVACDPAPFRAAVQRLFSP
ncbi:MAG TPA: nucleoside hydrolase [Iamia sp.]|nr:nucleoside hydrolase [Iamia sp.]